MRKLISRIHGGQKGFTLIELLVVIAILGVIAAIVALNVATFFGRGTVQAANTELHQVQTAVIACMADAEAGQLDAPGVWAGGPGVIHIGEFDASSYVYGPFRAAYAISINGTITSGDASIEGGWGTGIVWDSEVRGWVLAP